MSHALDMDMERRGLKDRGRSDVPGMNASRLTGEMSAGDLRLKDGRSMSEATAHRASSPKRFGVKPSSGAMSDISVPQTAPGKDDGTDYFKDWRENGGILQLPKGKTRKQDLILAQARLWLAGERTPDRQAFLQAAIELIANTDHKQASAIKVPLMAAKLYKEVTA